MPQASETQSLRSRTQSGGSIPKSRTSESRSESFRRIDSGKLNGEIQDGESETASLTNDWNPVINHEAHFNNDESLEDHSVATTPERPSYAFDSNSVILRSDNAAIRAQKMSTASELDINEGGFWKIL